MQNMSITTHRPTTLGLHPSIGFGDRLGLATAGHLAALQQHGGAIRGIFAQQSIREMQRTHRTPQQVMTDAMTALADGHASPIPHGQWGADADHLKTPEDVTNTASAGFVFFTIDPSDHVEQQADDYDDARIDELYTPYAWVDSYRNKTIDVPDGPKLAFDESTLKRAAVKYGRAILHALELAQHIKATAESLGQPFEIEVSVDETEQPTTLVEHYLVADLLIRGAEGHPGLGESLVSLAPRFIGELEKGIDYIGDVGAFEASLRDHAAIAERLGPYKLSLHSGSDKFIDLWCVGAGDSGPIPR
ncbi:MAG: tagaturonate epimerase family protein [Planctomycetota bacterium]